MPTMTPVEAKDQLSLALGVDANVASGADRKFPQWLRTRAQTAQDNLASSHGDVAFSEGQRRNQSGDLQEAYQQGEELIRQVNRYLNGLPGGINTAAVKAHYRLAQGTEGGFSHAEVEDLLTHFQSATTNVTSLDTGNSLLADAQLRASTLQAIGETLEEIDDHKAGAKGGKRQAKVAARKADHLAAEDALSRIFHYLSAALEGGVFDGELASYGFTPRQKPQAETPPPTPPTP